MKIGIDGRCLQDGKNTGVEEYARGLISQLLKNNNKDRFVVFLNAFNPIKEDFSWLEKNERVEMKKFSFPNKLLNLCIWLLNWPKIDKMIGGVDYFISPNLHFTALSPGCKQILTVHDLSFERMPETFSFKRRVWHFLINSRKVTRRADRIWPVSESTAQDLISIYGIEKEKIEVNYPLFDFDLYNKKNDFKEKQQIKEKYKLPEKFILFLGTIEPRKNIPGLIAGFESFKKRNSGTKDFKLVIAGEKGWLWESIIQKAEKSSVVEDIIFTGFVNEKDKVVLYSLARIFTYPSFYEGFGFPPLEAMASSVPTITSNCSSMPEILGDGAILINPYKPFEICLAIEKLLEDKKVYDYYSKKGRKQAELISRKKRGFGVKY